MDIKDFILIAGGLLIAAVVAHGFWIAWRARFEPLRLDIVQDLVPEDGDDLARFRGELPNGGGRVAPAQPSQGDLLSDMDVPVLLEPNLTPTVAASEPAANARREAERELLGQTPTVDAAADAPSQWADQSQDQTQDQPLDQHKVQSKDKRSEPDLFSPRTQEGTSEAQADGREPMSQSSSDHLPQHGVAEVILPEASIVMETPTVDDNRTPSTAAGTGLETDNSAEVERRHRLRPERTVEKKQSLPKREPRRLSAKPPALEADQPAANEPAAEVDELIVLHVLAKSGGRFPGDVLVDSMRARGLKFGAMNIFHRTDPMTKSQRYSVANATEPGVFDLSDVANLKSVGLTFFLQLPGPDEPLAALEDMIEVARSLANELQGEVRDEQRNLLTGQTVAHLRQRVSDHARKRLSKRA